MELVRKEKIASVILLDVKVSEDELMFYHAALSHVLNELDATELEDGFGAPREEIQGMHDDIADILARRGGTESLKVVAQAKPRLTPPRRKLA